MNPLPLYADVLGAYRREARFLISLALAIFIPIGLFQAVVFNVELDDSAFEIDDLLELIALLATIAVLAIASVLGSVFYSGAVTTAIPEVSHGQAPPSLREVARRIDFRRLIGVDLIYGVGVMIGIALLLAPGICLYAWWALAAPLVEIEGIGVRAALRRSRRLVRGRFWMVLALLLPVELLGGLVGEAISNLLGGPLRSDLLAEWLGYVVANATLTPVYAIAAVLLTVRLIREKEGDGTPVNVRRPA